MCNKPYSVLLYWRIVDILLLLQYRIMVFLYLDLTEFDLHTGARPVSEAWFLLPSLGPAHKRVLSRTFESTHCSRISAQAAAAACLPLCALQ